MLHERQLVRDAKAGCERAFETLLLDARSLGQRMALRMLRNEADAEDVVQDASLNAFRYLGAFRETAKFRTWFTSIVVRGALMLQRSMRSPLRSSMVPFGDLYVPDGYTVEDVLPPAEVVDAEEAVLRAEVVEWFCAELLRLPRVLRRSFTLSVIGGWTQGEIAERTGLCASTIRSQVRRSREKLREVGEWGPTV